jgi:hypothetical protein
MRAIATSQALGELEAAPRRKRILRRALVPILTLLIIVPVLARHIRKGEFNYDVDETQHAFTGVFAADLIRDHPIHNPVEYAYLYYAHYPALSGIIHWPPFFYGCEGLAFLLLGASVVTARLVILLFAAAGLWFWFRLVEELHSTAAAVVATVALALCPSVLLFEKTVMLEIPSLALCIVASYFWIRFLREELASNLIWFALTGAVAMLTKQNSIYLLLFCGISLFALGKWPLLWRRATFAALASGLCLTGPYYYALYKLHWSTVAGDVLEKHTSLLQRLIYYWRAIPQLTGWPLLIYSVVGLCISFWWTRKANTAVFLAWVISVYAMLTPIGHEAERYAIYLVPAVIYFAIWPLLLPGTARAWLRIPALAAMGAVLAYTAWGAWRFERPYVSGYAPVAREIRQLSDSGVVLVDAAIPANLVFFIRQQDTARRFVVLRRLLYVQYINETMGDGEEYVHTREELQMVFTDDGIRFIVVSNQPPAKFPIEVTLREMLETPQFRLVGRYPVEGNTPDWKNYSLSLYENLEASAPTAKFLRIPMLTIGHDIEVPFEKLGISPLKHCCPN